MTELGIPELALVVLIGASGSGKSTFAAQHFAPTQVISSDQCRGLVSDDDNDQSATADAFALLHYLAGKRLARGNLTVVDATNVQPQARKELIKVARDHDVLPVAIVLDVPVDLCIARNRSRPDRDHGDHVPRRHHDQLRRSLNGLAREGFRRVHVLEGTTEIDAVSVRLDKLLNDFTAETGPFDVIGDVHGCRAELVDLLITLGYAPVLDDQQRPVDAVPPTGRRAVFLGDLVDRGPDSPGVLRLVMGMVAAGHALCVPGNHEAKLVRALDGKKTTVSHGLAETLQQLASQPPEFVQQTRDFCYGLVSHLVLDGGRLVVAHAGLIEAYHGRASARVRAFALYGDTSGEIDEFGLPVRYPWAEDYRGAATVLYGHTPKPTVEWVNNTACLDTGCVFGGQLTAMRYPERKLVDVPAREVYYEPSRPLRPAERRSDLLDLTDVTGRRTIETAHHGRLAIADNNAAGALEVMSRFALDPRQLLYLPPTMSPPATSKRPELLEHPDEAFSYFREAGVAAVICEEKHMGSRAVVVLRRDGSGVAHTRTGRSFFDLPTTTELVRRLSAAAEVAGLFAEFGADWLVLDAELLPWSAKAAELIRDCYAAVGAAGRLATGRALSILGQATARGLDVAVLQAAVADQAREIDQFTTAYRRHCWPTNGLQGVRLAPFQLLASETGTYETRDHEWHLGIANRLRTADPELVAETRHRVVDLADPVAVDTAVGWWEELTSVEVGGEGMVVKPLANLTRGPKGLVQPGMKVRGREYLRLVYGPRYTEPGHLQRLRDRRLGHKRSLALREYALGLESLARVVRGEPLWRVHECVFAVLALESEPVDPRL
jgi:protein phosphatase